ncbi:hypothetical protein CGH51_06825 [Vibrio parahaemolyticus]|uniref:hypothetical protein n=1 Tax=Vibrio parahaemolyticus TaxID=670 RepID=UPI00040471E6|nr:hypothetical protein [Vibrio parahaemolyticus]EHK7404413.1 hypothetical protein [Vibrio parahaemolyticus]MDG2639243.1 hypothetical protein [Vibrio parahaemolyticus]TON76103.1 hypothetical protein CGH51_06825 [Vibrio parahaemolyticus]
MNYFIDDKQQIHAFKNASLGKGLTPLSQDEVIARLQPIRVKQLGDARLWVRSELKWCDLQRLYHVSGDTKRAVSTLDQINQYTIACRDYVSAEGDIGEARPVRPE